MRELFKKYELHTFARTFDGLGGWTEIWTKVRDIYGVLSMIDGDSTRKANQLIVDSTNIFLCEIGEAALVGQRIKQGNVFYRIDYIDNPVEADSHLELYLSRV